MRKSDNTSDNLEPKRLRNVTDIEHVPESRWFITLVYVVRTDRAQVSGIWIDKGKAHFEAVLPELGSHGSDGTKSHQAASFQGVFMYLSLNTWGNLFLRRCLPPECPWEIKESIRILFFQLSQKAEWCLAI